MTAILNSQTLPTLIKELANGELHEAAKICGGRKQTISEEIALIFEGLARAYQENAANPDMRRDITHAQGLLKQKLGLTKEIGTVFDQTLRGENVLRNEERVISLVEEKEEGWVDAVVDLFGVSKDKSFPSRMTEMVEKLSSRVGVLNEVDDLDSVTFPLGDTIQELQFLDPGYYSAVLSATRNGEIEKDELPETLDFLKENMSKLNKEIQARGLSSADVEQYLKPISELCTQFELENPIKQPEVEQKASSSSSSSTAEAQADFILDLAKDSDPKVVRLNLTTIGKSMKADKSLDFRARTLASKAERMYATATRESGGVRQYLIEDIEALREGEIDKIMDLLGQALEAEPRYQDHSGSIALLAELIPANGQIPSRYEMQKKLGELERTEKLLLTRAHRLLTEVKSVRDRNLDANNESSIQINKDLERLKDGEFEMILSLLERGMK